MPLELTSVQGKYLQAFAEGLQRVYESRMVTRDLRDFSQRKLADLQRGIFVIVANGTTADDNLESFRFSLVGQTRVPEKAPNSDIEEAELRMIDQLRAYIRGLRGHSISYSEFSQSQQLEAPHGWVQVDCTAGQFDADEWLTPELVDPIGINPFERLFTDIDIPEFMRREDRELWMNQHGDAPDYSKGEPDLQSRIDLPGGTR
ncbi:hypothetical protein [Burkholderia cenocepacia]|uniref:hypothetical protein n=1 Tax=Burkholderia cenocepacia TaxID=95486 RepID=UPI001B979E97|nr:hypothetical protein [Burkholderia cenocepacia]MBR8137189.1 hypothetical protein [Burkholderia cenocepacia]